MDDIREDLIRQATDTLQHSRSTLSQQVSFLENKGLTNVEIAEALRRSHEYFTAAAPQHGWIWNVLYPVAVIGAGCAAYIVSRAFDEDDDSEVSQLIEDDYGEGWTWPDNNSDVDPPEGRNRQLGKIEVALEEQAITVERAINSACSHLLDEQRGLNSRAPRWADELILTVSRQSRDISELRSQLTGLVALAGTAAYNASSTITATDCKNPGDMPLPQAYGEMTVGLLRRFKGALERLVETCEYSQPRPAANASNGELSSEFTLEQLAQRRKLLTQGCSTILMYMQKIVNSPNVSRYHKLSTNNPTFKSLVSPLEGHEGVLLAAGFERKGPANYEWAWGVLPDTGRQVHRTSSTGPSSLGDNKGLPVDGAVQPSTLSRSPASSSATACGGIDGRGDEAAVGTEVAARNEEKLGLVDGPCSEDSRGGAGQDCIGPLDFSTAVCILKSEIKMMQCLLDAYGQQCVHPGAMGSNSKSALRGKPNGKANQGLPSDCASSGGGLSSWNEKIEHIMAEEVSHAFSL